MRILLPLLAGVLPESLKFAFGLGPGVREEGDGEPTRQSWIGELITAPLTFRAIGEILRHLSLLQ